jgi:hypothetical protein
MLVSQSIEVSTHTCISGIWPQRKRKYKFKVTSLSTHEGIQWHYMQVPYQLHIPAALPPGKSDDTSYIRGWVDPTTRPDVLEYTLKNSLLLLGYESRTVQPVA